MGKVLSLIKQNKDESEKQVFLSDSEARALKKILAEMSDESATSITFEQMKKYLQPFMHLALIERLFIAMQWKHKAKHQQVSTRTSVSPVAFVYVIGNLLKGTHTQKAEIIRFMVGNRDLHVVTGLDLYYFTRDLLIDHLQYVAKQDIGIETNQNLDTIESSTENLAVALLHNLVNPDNLFENQLPIWAEFDDREVGRLLETNPVLLYMLNQIIFAAFPIYRISNQTFLPKFVIDDITDFRETILDIPSIIFLNTQIPKQSNMNHEWMMIFTSLEDIDSYTFDNLVTCCCAFENTLFIIEDSDQYRFGGFASERWYNFPKFRGSMNCFVFSLVPRMILYRATGINKNWVYLNDVSFLDRPKCLGFGGNIGLNAFSIDSDCESGVSYPTLTYNSPQLSSKSNYKISKVEVWAIFRSQASRTFQSTASWSSSQLKTERSVSVKSAVNLSDRSRKESDIPSVF